MINPEWVVKAAAEQCGADALRIMREIAEWAGGIDPEIDDVVQRMYDRTTSQGVGPTNRLRILYGLAADGLVAFTTGRLPKVTLTALGRDVLAYAEATHTATA